MVKQRGRRFYNNSGWVGNSKFATLVSAPPAWLLRAWESSVSSTGHDSRLSSGLHQRGNAVILPFKPLTSRACREVASSSMVLPKWQERHIMPERHTGVRGDGMKVWQWSDQPQAAQESKTGYSQIKGGWYTFASPALDVQII